MKGKSKAIIKSVKCILPNFSFKVEEGGIIYQNQGTLQIISENILYNTKNKLVFQIEKSRLSEDCFIGFWHTHSRFFLPSFKDIKTYIFLKKTVINNFEFVIISPEFICFVKSHKIFKFYVPYFFFYKL